jgi:TetR/AcrR family transcriptional regulator, transcriptional repressor for nem operon
VRHAPGKKRETRRRVIGAAGRRFKQHGFAGASLHEVMRDVDLTVGGFYAHFASKEALLAAVLELAIDDNTRALFYGLEEHAGEDWLREVARRYLSRRHRDEVADGCPIPAIAAEISRSGPEVREACERALLRCQVEMARRIPARGDLDADDRSLATMALLIGGVLVARAVHDRELSDRVLSACRRMAAEPAEEKSR